MKLRLAFRRPLARVLSLAIIPASVSGFLVVTGAAPAAASASCQLQSPTGAIKHVIEVQFDNVHLSRDNPNVPSDLEQMPNLKNFLENNGFLSNNHHTPLISHTADDIITTLTGLYPDKHGMAVSNSYRVFKPSGTSSFANSFQYWTDQASPPADTKPNLITTTGKTTPAPWVPFTRAGCNVGGVSTANIELEGTSSIASIFGSPSPELTEAQTNSNQATADFVGIAIHCAQGSAVCASSPNARPDTLPDEPGGYTGFQGLFGHKYVAPVIAPPGSDLRDSSGNMTDLNGQTMISADSGTPGFPGFGGISASQSLAYVAAMQEHGVPITYAYISDAHGDHTNDSAALGPGEAKYEQQLRAYDDAFGKFFARLSADGLNKSNTLFVFTSDENDHYAGRAGTPAGCDGVTVFCNYDHGSANPTIGEISGNLAALLKAETGNTTSFAIHSDTAPAVYITGNPARDAAVTRQFDHDLARLVDPQNRNTGQPTPITQRLADSVELNFLHMVTADPQRTPTLVDFANPDYFFFSFPTSTPCSATVDQTPSSCLSQNSFFAWNHGDFQPEIVTTWLGMVGPGIKNLGDTSDIWSDHTDVRPTILSLVGLKDDYRDDGRVLVEAINSGALPAALRSNIDEVQQLAEVYKQINAPVGQLGLQTLRDSTTALEGDDATYTRIENQITDLTSQRNSIAGQMIAMLNAATFDGVPINANQADQLIQQGEALIQNNNLQ